MNFDAHAHHGDPINFALFSAVVSIISILVAAINARIVSGISQYASLLGGLLLGYISLTHLLPEAFSHGHWAWVVAGVVTGLALSLLSHVRPSSTPDSAMKWTLALSVSAIAIHSLLDGMVYVLSFSHGHAEGAMTASGLVFHEFPEGLICFALAAGLLKNTKLAALLAILAASVTTPAGAFLASMISHDMEERFAEIAFPLAAGFVSFTALSLLKNFIAKQVSKRAI